MSIDFIKPQRVRVMCMDSRCGRIFLTELMTEYNVSAVGCVGHPDLIPDSVPVLLPCGHFIGVRGLIPGFKPRTFWVRIGSEDVDVATLATLP